MYGKNQVGSQNSKAMFLLQSRTDSKNSAREATILVKQSVTLCQPEKYQFQSVFVFLP